MLAKYLLAGLLFMTLVSCDKPQSDTESLQQSKVENSMTETVQPPQVTMAEMTALISLQIQIMREPEKRQFRIDYCNYSASNPNWFITAGAGRVKNPETGVPIPMRLARRAAQLDAARWALYAKTWSENDFDKSFGELSGQLTEPQQLINESVANDSLIVIMAFRR